jgi:predicted metalloendopeptidase
VSTDTGKAGIFYRSCMDTASINKLGATPLKPYLGKIKCSFLFFSLRINKLRATPLKLIYLGNKFSKFLYIVT